MQPSTSNHLPFAFLKRNSSYISVCPKTKKPFTQSSSCFQILSLQIAFSFQIASLSPVKNFPFLPSFVLRKINDSVRGLCFENVISFCTFNPLVWRFLFFPHYAMIDLKPSFICLFEAKYILHFSMS